MRSIVTAATLAVLLAGCSDVASDQPPQAAATPTASSTPSSSPSARPSSSAVTAGPSAPGPSGVASVVPSPTAEPPAPAPSGGPEDPLVPLPALESPAPLGAPTCRARDLTMVDGDAIVTPQNLQEVFVLRTAGPECQLEGFPQVQLRDAAGVALAIKVVRGGFGLPEEKAEPFSLSRSTSLSFRVASPRAGACRPVASVVVTLPGTGGPLSADSFLTACGDTVGVSPVERGGSDH